jgi:hypothetical protein
VVIILVLGCLGGVGYGVYYFANSPLVTAFTNPSATPSTGPSGPPSPAPKKTGEGDGATIGIGQCVTVRKEGPDNNFVDRASCGGKGAYKVVARFPGTTDTDKCESTSADTTYEFDNSDGSSSDYVLCLKKQ